jgi:hypothetical protein
LGLIFFVADDVGGGIVLTACIRSPGARAHTASSPRSFSRAAGAAGERPALPLPAGTSCRSPGSSASGRTAPDEPVKYWLSNLPEQTPLDRLVSLAKLRWRIEHGYRQLKDALGLDRFEGRSFWG